MTLTYNCVICHRKIKNPQALQYTCHNVDCIKEYRYYLKTTYENRKDFKDNNANINRRNGKT
jgi:hypothetical protein